MNKFFLLIRDHVKEDFHGRLYGCLLLFLSISLYINFQWELEYSLVKVTHGSFLRVLYFFSLYCFAYFTTIFLCLAFRKELRALIKQKKFWVMSFAGIAVLSVDRGFPYLSQLLYIISKGDIYFYLFRLGNYAISFLLVFTPLYFFYKRFDGADSGFYGINTKTSFQEYIKLWLMLLPLLALASLTTGFRNFYPVYQPDAIAQQLNLPEFLPVLFFELIYGADYINVELLFRGFFVIGIGQILGRHAILPMVAIYCFLHFGKPIGEAISSIAGGYVLGILAYYTRSIWGGIMVHIAVAWTMELCAYLVNTFNNS